MKHDFSAIALSVFIVFMALCAFSSCNNSKTQGALLNDSLLVNDTQWNDGNTFYITKQHGDSLYFNNGLAASDKQKFALVGDSTFLRVVTVGTRTITGFAYPGCKVERRALKGQDELVAIDSLGRVCDVLVAFTGDFNTVLETNIVRLVEGKYRGITDGKPYWFTPKQELYLPGLPIQPLVKYTIEKEKGIPTFAFTYHTDQHILCKFTLTGLNVYKATFDSISKTWKKDELISKTQKKSSKYQLGNHWGAISRFVFTRGMLDYYSTEALQQVLKDVEAYYTALKTKPEALPQQNIDLIRTVIIQRKTSGDAPTAGLNMDQ